MSLRGSTAYVARENIDCKRSPIERRPIVWRIVRIAWSYLQKDQSQFDVEIFGIMNNILQNTWSAPNEFCLLRARLTWVILCAINDLF